ncbi:MAG: dihydroorotate dehydrogenase [Planctomycetota bacterium]|nr:dihydroorotate dehydrogenase [Planctomycetota bacterium]
MPTNPDTLATNLSGLTLRNPLILAAGTAGYIDELSGPTDLSRVGAVVTKSITSKPREGNPTWRILETSHGMLNAIGLANVGAERFKSEYAPRVAATPTTIIGSIAEHSIDGYLAVAHMFAGCEHIPAVELNVSCPNVHGGADFGDSPEALANLLREVRPALADKKLFVKLPPIITSSRGATIVDVARAAIDHGADALSLTNTVPAMALDVDTRAPRLANVTGGLSGPAIHPVIVRLVHLVYRNVARETNTPIIAIGGILNWRDAAEFILAGASAVQIGAALFADPRAPHRIIRGLERWTARERVSNIAELTGALRLPDPRP